MRRFLLDTNICLAYIREHEIVDTIENDLSLNDKDTIIMISVVTKAELLSLGKQLEWGNNKLSKLNRLLEKFFIIDINNSDKDLIRAYYTIDAYSQGRLKEKTLKGSARNMGKNDLWIAATTYVANASLITMDRDFDHLSETFITVHTYPPN